MEKSLRALAEFAADFVLERTPAEVQAEGRRQLGDGIGCIIGAATETPIVELAKFEARPDGPATFLGQRLRGTAEAAALVGGAAGVFLDYDSGQRFSGSHPAIHVVPAVLALAEEIGASGREVLAATIVGCEAGARIGVAAGRLRPGMSPHGGWAVIGAAVAAARLLRFDADAIENTMNLASSLTLMTSTSVHTVGANVRHLQAGLGAQRGIVAARLHRDGFTGERDGVAVVFGNFVTPSFNHRRATIQLGERWELLRGYYKRHACARFSHSAIDALLAIRRIRQEQGNVQSSDVSRIDVETFNTAAGLTALNPPTALAARFSVPHTLAAAWVRGDAGPASFDGAARRYPAIRKLAQQVHVVEDPGYSALVPEYRPARVTVTFADGSRLSEERLNAQGEQEDYARDVWLASKFDALVSPVLGPMVTAVLRGRIADVDRLASLDELISLTVPPAGK